MQDILVLRKVNDNPKYTFETNISKMSLEGLGRYMFDIVIDVLSLDKSTSKSDMQKFEDSKKQLDILRTVDRTNPKCKNFWNKRGMNPFGMCIITHYNMDFAKFWAEKSSYIIKSKGYKCNCDRSVDQLLHEAPAHEDVPQEAAMV